MSYVGIVAKIFQAHPNYIHTGIIHVDHMRVHEDSYADCGLITPELCVNLTCRLDIQVYTKVSGDELSGNVSGFHLEICDRREAQSSHTKRRALPSEASGKQKFN